jgi:hypothetical protein
MIGLVFYNQKLFALVKIYKVIKNLFYIFNIVVQ